MQYSFKKRTIFFALFVGCFYTHNVESVEVDLENYELEPSRIAEEIIDALTEPAEILTLNQILGKNLIHIERKRSEPITFKLPQETGKMDRKIVSMNFFYLEENQYIDDKAGVSPRYIIPRLRDLKYYLIFPTKIEWSYEHIKIFFNYDRFNGCAGTITINVQPNLNFKDYKKRLKVFIKQSQPFYPESDYSSLEEDEEKDVNENNQRLSFALKSSEISPNSKIDGKDPKKLKKYLKTGYPLSADEE